VSEFRLLGLVEIWSGGRRVLAGQPRQRLVLAALLVDAGRPVTSESLVYRVWGDTPPGGARHAIHEYLARIRRMLGDLDRPDLARLARRGSVYVLDVDPDRVDLHRFRRLVEWARDPGCPDAERVETLSRALDLWRGAPMADLSGEWVELVREGARRQRLEAATLWAQALLRLGRPSEVIEPLAELSAENPLSEPVAAVLIRALHAAGLTVEALDCYTRIRKRLVDDLGTEPGPELQAAHQAVLRGETEPGPARPALPVEAAAPPVEAAALPVEAAALPVEAAAPPEVSAPAGPARPGPPHVVPAQLPAAVRGFAGRDRELARLDAVLADAQGHATTAICAISGTAGVGKSALAVHWAHRVAERFPDGQLYVNLRGFDPAGAALSPSDAIRGFLDALDVPPQRISPNLAAQAALYRSMLARRRMLILLDNARDAEQVRPLLPGTPGCTVIVTSRRQLASLVAIDGAQALPLDVLTDDESRELLARRLGDERVGSERRAVEEIITRCARLPLAFAVVAARAAVHPSVSLAAMAHDLDDIHERLDTLSAGDAASDVRAVFSWSYQALSPAAAELFRLLGLHPGPDISAAAAASLAGVPPAAVGPRLAELVEAHLLTEHLPGRYGFHDLLRAYAVEQANRNDSEPSRRAGLHRLLDHYLHTADAADRFLNTARDPITLSPLQPGVTPEAPADLDRALAWFAAEHRVLLASVDRAAASGFDIHTWQLAWTLTTILHRRRDGEAYAATQVAAVAATARLGDPANQLGAHRSLARAYIMLGRYDDAEAQLQQALTLAGQTGDPILHAHTHLRLAYLHEVRGNHAAALDHARQALALYEAAGHRNGQGHALNGVGWYHTLLGQHEQAIPYCERSVALHEEVGDRDGQAAAWDSLGFAQYNLGHHAEALACYQRALDLLREVGDRYQQTMILAHIGDAHEAAGDPAAARATYEQALEILDELAHRDAEKVREKLRELAHEEH
jgi:DNA-binding SARP family transcriptional activator/Tfp pilus assembly protein PilF